MLNLLLERKAHVLKDYLYIRTYILSRTKEQDRAFKPLVIDRPIQKLVILVEREINMLISEMN